jgi:hypothetical protein
MSIEMLGALLRHIEERRKSATPGSYLEAMLEFAHAYIPLAFYLCSRCARPSETVPLLKLGRINELLTLLLEHLRVNDQDEHGTIFHVLTLVFRKTN